MGRPMRIRAVVVACALVMGLCETGQGAVIYVDAGAVGAADGSSWADAFVHLQEALTVAEAGDEVRVAEGVYRPDQGAGQGPGYRGATFALLDGVALRGGFAGVGTANPDARDIAQYETVLSGDLAGDDVPVVNPHDLLTEPTRAENSPRVVSAGLCSRSAVLDGFTIASAYAPDRRVDNGAGLYLSGGDAPCCPSIRNCTFRGHAGGAVYAWNASPELIDCVFEHNAARYGGPLKQACRPVPECETVNW